MTRLQIALIAAALSTVAVSTAAPSLAQRAVAPTVVETAPAPTAAPSQPAAAAEARPAEDALDALVRALRDEAARARLLEALSTPPAETPDTTAPPASEAPPDGAQQDASPPADATLGRRLAVGLQEAGRDAAALGVQVLNGLRATQRRLAGLTPERVDALAEVARSLGWVLASTIAVFLALRGATRAFYRRLALRAAGARPLAKVGLWVATVALEVVGVLVPWAIGGAVAVVIAGGDERVTLNAALYLNAFLAAQLTKVALRAVVAPDMSDLRPAPFTDAGARALSWRLATMASILGYGLLFVAPVVADVVSIFTARAVQVVTFAVVIVWAMALTIRWRAAPSRYFAARAEDAGGDATLRAIAWALRYWHWPALAWLAALFVNAVVRSGGVAPLLTTTAQVAGVLLIGAVAGAAASHLARRGVRLPSDLSSAAPLLEPRINAFLTDFLGVARFVIAAAAVGTAVDVSGALNVGGWIAATFGEDFASAVISVALITLGAFALWLVLASWVDYRLTPEAKRAATAREQTLLTLMRNAATVAIVIFALMFALSELGLDIAPLIASAGVFGLALGFGAQKLVQDIITGVFIQFESAINVGDVVTVAGTTGAVERLTIRSVTLRTLDGTVHIIPFSSVDMVSNFNRGFAFHVADIGVAYREDVDEAKALMFAAFEDIKSHPDHGAQILGQLEWFGVNALGDSAVTLRARLRTRPGGQWAVGRAYNEAVKKRFDAAGVEIPFPQQTLWFGEPKSGEPPALHVRSGAVREASTPPPIPVAPSGPLAPHPDDDR